MQTHIKEYVKSIESQSQLINNFDVESFISYKNSLLVAVINLFDQREPDEVLQDLKDEVSRGA